MYEPHLEKPEDFLDYAMRHNFGELHFKVDKKTNLKAIIAIHSTKLGPALGGCRFVEYSDTENAIRDAMRLARGMSYKAALSNLPLGGGKAVIMKPKEFDRSALFHSFGAFIETLNGRYITALDSGTELSDMEVISEHTPYVASLLRLGGDPSPHTAEGVLNGIRAALFFRSGKQKLNGMHIAIQGLGHVGHHLANLLHQEGATLTVSDIDEARVKSLEKTIGAKVASPENIHRTNCDLFAPCALGAVLNAKTIQEINAPIVAGAANNQLEHHEDDIRLFEKGILYAPDYVINAGGLIYAASHYLPEEASKLEERIENIGTSLLEIFKRSQKENMPTGFIADKIAEEKLGNE